MAPRQREAWGVSPAASSVSRPRSGGIDCLDSSDYATPHACGDGNFAMREDTCASAAIRPPSQPRRPYSGEDFQVAAQRRACESISGYPPETHGKNAFSNRNHLPRASTDTSRVCKELKQAWETRQEDTTIHAVGRQRMDPPASVRQCSSRRYVATRKETGSCPVSMCPRVPADRARLNSHSQRWPPVSTATRRSLSTGPNSKRGIVNGRGPALPTGHGWR